MPAIAIDFDRPLHRYSKGWHTRDIYDEPTEGAFEALQQLYDEGWDIIVHSARDSEAIEEWLAERLAETCYTFTFRVTNIKPPEAMFFVDDRAIHWRNWQQAITEIKDRLALEVEHPHPRPR